MSETNAVEFLLIEDNPHDLEPSLCARRRANLINRETYHLRVNSCIVKPVNFEGFTTAVHDPGICWLLLNPPPQVTD